MKTMTTASTEAPASGRITVRSMTMPPTKAMPSVRKKAAQYGSPAWISDHAI